MAPRMAAATCSCSGTGLDRSTRMTGVVLLIMAS
jgi:hypothetical protein